MSSIADATSVGSEASALPARPAWRQIENYAAPAAVFLAIVVPYLRFHEYSLLLPESLIIIGCAIAAGVAVGALSLAGSLFRAMVIGVVLCIYLFYRPEFTYSIILNAIRLGRIIGDFGLALAIFAVPASLIAGLVCLLFGRHLNKVVLAVFGTIVATTILLPTSKGGEAIVTGALPAQLNDLPPLIHIILDEHTAVGGMPEEFDPAGDAQRSIKSTYADFQLYDRVYSRFAETKYSLAALMNGDIGPEAVRLVDSQIAVNALYQSEWFDRLKHDGYAVRLYQTNFLDMCKASASVDSCYTYALFSPNALQRTGLPTGDRLSIIAENMLYPGAGYQTGPLAATELLERLPADIAEAPRGVAYVVHLILPHHDYLFERDCSLADRSLWRREDSGEDVMFSRDQRGAIYRRYLEQVLCTEKRMDAFFADLKARGLYDDATIIVHGDHGSRIGEHYHQVTSAEILTDQDVVDHFATLLAVKAPGVEPGITHEEAPLQQVFADTFLGGSKDPADGVLIRERDGKVVRRDFVWPAQETDDTATEDDNLARLE